MKAILIALAAALPACLTAAGAAKPNILVVLVDDLGYSDLGCYGGEIPTPNIDSLAKGGLRYTGMTNSARCCPSRASLLTGLHPAQAGIPDFVASLTGEWQKWAARTGLNEKKKTPPDADKKGKQAKAKTDEEE